MKAIKCPDPKKIISQFYSMLSLPQATMSAYALKNRWEGEMWPVADEEWSDTCKLVSPKLSDRLTRSLYCTDHISHRSESPGINETNPPTAQCVTKLRVHFITYCGNAPRSRHSGLREYGSCLILWVPL